MLGGNRRERQRRDHKWKGKNDLDLFNNITGIEKMRVQKWLSEFMLWTFNSQCGIPVLMVSEGGALDGNWG